MRIELTAVEWDLLVHSAAMGVEHIGDPATRKLVRAIMALVQGRVRESVK